MNCTFLAKRHRDCMRISVRKKVALYNLQWKKKPSRKEKSLNCATEDSAWTDPFNCWQLKSGKIFHHVQFTVQTICEISHVFLYSDEVKIASASSSSGINSLATRAAVYSESEEEELTARPQLNYFGASKLKFNLKDGLWKSERTLRGLLFNQKRYRSWELPKIEIFITIILNMICICSRVRFLFLFSFSVFPQNAHKKLLFFPVTIYVCCIKTYFMFYASFFRLSEE